MIMRSNLLPLLVALSVGAACALGPVQADAQRNGSKFDESFQRRAMRELAGPDALCQEEKGKRICTYEHNDYDIRVFGSDQTLLARLTLRNDKAAPQIKRMGALAEAYGFSHDVWTNLVTRAVDQTAGVVAADANEIRLACRANGDELIFDFVVLPPKPKSTF